MKHETTELIILGSTGSVGRQTLDVVRAHPDRFKVVGLCAYRNVALLAEQVAEFRPRRVAVLDENAYSREYANELGIPVFAGNRSFEALCATDRGDVVMNALVGMAGIEPTLFALQHGKDIALVNKETLVVGGALIMQTAKAHQKRVIPVDSEHSAIYQCLQSGRACEIERLILTCSGGPFRLRTFEEMRYATVDEALAHPTWRMGKKITIDSATLMNKGFEVIEAMHLFGVPLAKIDIVIHPQSIVHSLVEFKDRSTIAHLGMPDMRVPIQYAISRGERLPTDVAPLRLEELRTLHFDRVPLEHFPCLRLARLAAERGGTYPAALTAANDFMVGQFLQGTVAFGDIARGVRAALAHHQTLDPLVLADIRRTEHDVKTQLARQFVGDQG